MADQLGPHFDDGGDILLIEAKGVLARRPYHWAKAHLILSALRHRHAELGSRASYVYCPGTLVKRLMGGRFPIAVWGLW